MNSSLVITEGSLLSRFLLLQWMVALSLCKVVYCRDFWYSNRWQPFHYGRQSVFEIFVTLMDGSLVIVDGSLLLIFLLFQWIVAFSLWNVFCCRCFCYPMDSSLVIMEGSLLSRFLLRQWMVAWSILKVVCYRYLSYSNG